MHKKKAIKHCPEKRPNTIVTFNRFANLTDYAFSPSHVDENFSYADVLQDKRLNNIGYTKVHTKNTKNTNIKNNTSKNYRKKLNTTFNQHPYGNNLFFKHSDRRKNYPAYSKDNVRDVNYYYKKYTPFGQIFTHKLLPDEACLLYTSPSPRDRQKSRMPSSA